MKSGQYLLQTIQTLFGVNPTDRALASIIEAVELDNSSAEDIRITIKAIAQRLFMTSYTERQAVLESRAQRIVQNLQEIPDEMVEEKLQEIKEIARRHDLLGEIRDIEIEYQISLEIVD